MVSKLPHANLFLLKSCSPAHQLKIHLGLGISDRLNVYVTEHISKVVRSNLNEISTSLWLSLYQTTMVFL